MEIIYSLTLCVLLPLQKGSGIRRQCNANSIWDYRERNVWSHTMVTWACATNANNITDD